jgi:hypothetical protein
MWGMIAQAAGGLIGGVSKLFLAAKQAREADKIHPFRTNYEASPYAKANVGLAQNAYNGRAAGAEQMQAGLDASQANTINAGNRNATSSADALAIAAGAQGATNSGYAQLGTMEEQHRQAAMGALMQANQGMVTEGDKVYNDKLLAYQEQLDAKNALLGAATQNKYGAFSDLGNGLMMAGQNVIDYKRNQAYDKKFGINY